VTAHLDDRGVFVPRLHAQHRVDHGEGHAVVAAPGEQFAQVNAELNETGAKPVAFGRGPVRVGNLTQEIAAVKLEGLLAKLDRLIGPLRAEAA